MLIAMLTIITLAIIIFILLLKMFEKLGDYALDKEKERRAKSEKAKRIRKYEKETSIYDNEARKLMSSLFYKALIKGIKDKMISEIQIDSLSAQKDDFGYSDWIEKYCIYPESRRCYLGVRGYYHGVAVYYIDLKINIEEIAEHDVKVLKRALSISPYFFYGACDGQREYLRFESGFLKAEYNSKVEEYKRKQANLHEEYKRRQTNLHNNLYK